MRLAFYKASYGDWADKLIAWWNRPNFWNVFESAKYSHVEMIFSNGEFFSSSYRDGGVRYKMIDIDEKWDIFNVDCFMNEEAFRYRCNREVGKKYDIKCIFFTFMIPFEIQDPNKWICSEIVGSLMFHLSKPHKYSPQKLSDHLTKRKILTKIDK